MATLFVTLGNKILSGGQKFVYDIYGYPNSPQADKLFFSKLIQTPQFVYFYELLLCLLKDSLSDILSTQWPQCEAPLWQEHPIPTCTQFHKNVPMVYISGKKSKAIVHALTFEPLKLGYVLLSQVSTLECVPLIHFVGIGCSNFKRPKSKGQNPKVYLRSPTWKGKTWFWKHCFLEIVYSEKKL